MILILFSLKKPSLAKISAELPNNNSSSSSINPDKVSNSLRKLDQYTSQDNNKPLTSLNNLLTSRSNLLINPNNPPISHLINNTSLKILDHPIMTRLRVN